MINAEATMKENLSMDLINDLFGACKKKRVKENGANRTLGSTAMQGRMKQTNDNPT